MEKSIFVSLVNVTYMTMALLSWAAPAAVAQTKYTEIKNIVLVHGAFADASGWLEVHKILTAKGYHVTCVQNPCTSLEDDVAATNRILDRQDGPVILVGHSWGGAVITEAGAHSKVAGLVYVDAFQPDAGESVGNQLSSVPDLSAGAIAPDSHGFLNVTKEKFHNAFCADLPENLAAFMWASQVPIAEKAVGTTITSAAWKTKPCWAVIGTEDKMLNPTLARSIYKRSNSKVTEIAGASHVVFMSHPMEVAKIIDSAARGAADKH